MACTPRKKQIARHQYSRHHPPLEGLIVSWWSEGVTESRREWKNKDRILCVISRINSLVVPRTLPCIFFSISQRVGKTWKTSLWPVIFQNLRETHQVTPLSLLRQTLSLSLSFCRLTNKETGAFISLAKQHRYLSSVCIFKLSFQIACLSLVVFYDDFTTSLLYFYFSHPVSLTIYIWPDADKHFLSLSSRLPLTLFVSCLPFFLNNWMYRKESFFQ